MTDASHAATICFDATGTLIEVRAPVGDVYHRIALEHGVDLPAWRLDDAFRRVLRQAPARGLDGATREERCASEIDWWFERIRQTFQATDSTARFDDFRAFAQALFDHYQSDAAWRTREGVAQALTQLRQLGCFLAVTSNFDHRLPKILELLDLTRFFLTIEVPCQMGRAKPDRAIFEAVAEASGRPLHSLVYVGDDPPEMLAAIAAHGLRVIDIRAVQEFSALADLLLNASNSHAPATLPSTTPVVDS